MSEPLLLGLDLGTSAIKAGAFTPDGRAVALQVAPTPTVHEGAGLAHHDPEALWASSASLLGQLMTDLGPAGPTRLACLGLCSFGESGVLVGADGASHGSVLAWFDTRPQPVMPRLLTLMDAATWRARTGLHPDHTYGLPKLLWAAEQRSLAGRRWLSVADFLAYRLTGRATVGHTQAARALLLDLTERRWMPEVLASLNLPPGLLPELRPPGDPLGEVTPTAAHLTGLPAGLPVWEAAHDQPCAAVGVGATRPGVTVNACGTAETLLAALDTGHIEEVLTKPGLNVQPHALPDLAYAISTLRASGSTLDWAVRLCGEPALAALPDLPSDVDDLLFFPHLRALSDDPADPELPGGAFLGLRPDHAAPHLLRAVLEGLTFELARRHQRLLTGLSGPPSSLRAVGGPTRHAAWMALKADALGAELQTADQPHVSVWGAAWLAWRHLNAAAGQLTPPPTFVPEASFAPRPNPGLAARQARYEALLPALAAALTPVAPA